MRGRRGGTEGRNGGAHWRGGTEGRRGTRAGTRSASAFPRGGGRRASWDGAPRAAGRRGLGRPPGDGSRPGAARGSRAGGGRDRGSGGTRELPRIGFGWRRCAALNDGGHPEEHRDQHRPGREHDHPDDDRCIWMSGAKFRPWVRSQADSWGWVRRLRSEDGERHRQRGQNDASRHHGPRDPFRAVPELQGNLHLRPA